MPTLSEFASKRLLADAGVPVAEDRLVADSDGAVAAAQDLGFPVVAKLCGDAIAHKTERGLVRLGLEDGEAVRRAADDLLARAQPGDGEVGLVIAPMVQGTRELIAGAVHDPTFGPAVMVGIGGVLAEALSDVAFRLAPLSGSDAEDMLGDLRSCALLGSVRGEPPIDRAAVAAVLVALGELLVADNGIIAIDVNPLIICDGRPVAVDALVETAAP